MDRVKFEFMVSVSEMKVAIVYYSKTGNTRKIAERVKSEISKLNVDVDCFEIRSKQEYSNKMLHLNPRLIYDVMFKEGVEICGDEGFNPNKYNLVLIGSPIWYNRVAPAIKTFIKRYAGKIEAPIACFTTSKLNINYSANFKKQLETLGYRVIANKTVVIESEESAIKELIEELKTILR